MVIFTRCEINTDAYYREVRRCLYVNMGEVDQISFSMYRAFCRRYEREGSMFNKDNTRPKFDAWCLVRGTSRLAFNYTKFFQRYPTAKEQVYAVRKKLEIDVKDNLK